MGGRRAAGSPTTLRLTLTERKFVFARTPCAKPVWSSSGPPGAWITPSSDWKREPMILRIDRYSALGSLDPGDVDLAHRHHRFECSPGCGLVGIAVGPQQRTR